MPAKLGTILLDGMGIVFMPNKKSKYVSYQEGTLKRLSKLTPGPWVCQILSKDQSPKFGMMKLPYLENSLW